MSQSEHHYLDVMFLKDQIQEAIDAMSSFEEKAKEELEIRRWLSGYRAGLQYASELAGWLTTKDEMFERWKAQAWSNGLDERDYENAKAEYEMQK